MMKKILIALCFLSLCKYGLTLYCYTCSVGEQDTDTTCIDHPEKTTKTNCNKKYCTVIRQEYLDPQNKVASILRTCEDKPMHMNEVIEDGTYRFYYTACQERLCNGGSGKSSDGGSDSGALGDKSNLLVPGTGSSTFVHISISLLLFAIVTLQLI